MQAEVTWTQLMAKSGVRERDLAWRQQPRSHQPAQSRGKPDERSGGDSGRQVAKYETPAASARVPGIGPA